MINHHEAQSWASATVGHCPTWMAALKVCEEAGELAGAVVKPLDGLGSAGGDVAEESADVLISLLTFCHLAGVDIEAAYESKLRELWQAVS